MISDLKIVDIGVNFGYSYYDHIVVLYLRICLYKGQRQAKSFGLVGFATFQSAVVSGFRNIKEVGRFKVAFGLQRSAVCLKAAAKLINPSPTLFLQIFLEVYKFEKVNPHSLNPYGFCNAHR